MATLNWYRHKFLMFENFFILTESHNWCAEINKQRVEEMFKEANDLEMFCSKLEERKLREEFSIKLYTYFKGQGRFVHNEFEFYWKACDTLLTKFLSDSRIDDNMVKIAIVQYCIYCKGSRLGSVVKQFIDVASAFSVLEDVIIECDSLTVEARLIYESWCKRVNCLSGNVKSLDEMVMNMLLSGVKSTNIVFCILCFKENDETSKVIKDCIISKLETNSVVKCMQLWKCLIELPSDKITFIVEHFPNILNSLFDVITIISKTVKSVLIENELHFVSDTEESIELKDIVKLLNLLYNIGGIVKERVENYIHSKNNSSQYFYFEDLENQFVKRFSLRS